MVSQGNVCCEAQPIEIKEKTVNLMIHDMFHAAFMVIGGVKARVKE